MECDACGGSFIVSAGEKAFYESRTGAPHEPSRCLKCRVADRTPIDLDALLADESKDDSTS